MFDFSKYKYASLIFSGVLALVFLLVTFIVFGGFAHSLDFDGGLRTTINFPSSTKKESVEVFFKKQGIEALVIQLNEDLAKSRINYQIDIGLDALQKIRNYNKENVSQAIVPEKKEEPANKDKVPVDKTKTPQQEKPIEVKEEPKPVKPRADVDEFIIMLKHGFQLEEEQILSADQVGAIVGGELTSTGISLLVWTVVIMTLYLSFRFQFKFALGASLAVIHDLILSLAFIGAFQIKPSVPIIAALLTIMGYSINDTIVIFDRIRENTSEKIKYSFSHLINISINQTLSRTINTSMATLVSVLALVIGQASELLDFAYVIIFGIFIGTYSSIFIAAPVVEIYSNYQEKRKNATPVVKAST
ncbi:MAG: protein translocase subunit SecF [Leptospiraceae bacterium]|nr:protein translocase subunit SecF [Leptospiraceae bacterium]